VDAYKRDAAAVSPVSGDAWRRLAGASLDHAVGHQFVRMWAPHVTGAIAHTPRGSKEWLVHPWRPTPEGGDAGLAGVRAPVLRHVWMTRDGGKLMLTTRRRSGSSCRRRKDDGDEVQRRQRARGGALADEVAALGEGIALGAWLRCKCEREVRELELGLNRDRGRGERRGRGGQRLAIDGRRPSREVGPGNGWEMEGGERRED
jgi:hypothetical protein